MANLIEFPTGPEHLEALPGPDDEYRAAAPPADEPCPSLTLVFPDESMRSYRFCNIERMEFSPADGSPDGFDLLNFGVALRPANKLTVVRIEGRNLFDLFNDVSQHRTRWLRVLPARHQAKDPAAPIITRIVLPGGDV